MIETEETEETEETNETATTDGERPLPDGWRWVRLGDVCELNPRRPHIERAEDTSTSFIPMAAVFDGGRDIVEGEVRPFGEVQKGYTYFANDDVLFAKITPYMQNGKIAIARNLIDGIGFGTTEFHILRASHLIQPEWVQLFLRQQPILNDAERHMTGAVGQQRLPASYLADIQIPLPPLPEQRRIAAILRERLAAVEQARASAEAQLAAARALPAAYLRAVFESDEARAWPRAHVADACSRIDYGYTASADFGVTEPRFLRITDIQNGQVDWNTVPGCKIAPADEAANLLADGDIVFARTGGTTGKSYLVSNPPRAVFASYLIRLRPKAGIDPQYLYTYFQTDDYWRQIGASSRGGAQPNVNATLLGAITLPLPPLPEQQRIVALIEEQMSAVERLRAAQSAQLDAIAALPQALLRQAFAGGM